MRIFMKQTGPWITAFCIMIISLLSACQTGTNQTRPEIDSVYGLVTVSVCNIRPEPAHRSELITQAVMGTPVKILDFNGGWYYIRTPGGYEGWVDSPAVKRMSTEEFKTWKESGRIIYLRKYGDLYSDTLSVNIISDMVAGGIVGLREKVGDYYRVILPDGREGFMPYQAGMRFDDWLSEAEPEEKNLDSLSHSFMGTPYLWGGTSAKGFDCSGFTKTIYYLNGIILARDASQQYGYGIKIDPVSYPDSLRIGDLMFFGYTKDGMQRPTHVGMYIGDSEFIHASGMVKINSLDSTRINFSRGRKDAFLGVRRIIGAEPGEGLQPVATHPWYN